MHGPPGCGKSIIAKDLALGLKMDTFYNVNEGNITSKYHGESPKLVELLF